MKPVAFLSTSMPGMHLMIGQRKTFLQLRCQQQSSGVIKRNRKNIKVVNFKNMIEGPFRKSGLEVVIDYDYTFTTNYKGSLNSASQQADENVNKEVTTFRFASGFLSTAFFRIHGRRVMLGSTGRCFRKRIQSYFMMKWVI